MTQPKNTPPAPKVGESQVPPSKGDPQEWRIDEAEDESFPASDPNAETQPHPTKK